jgi:hypothetical protein
MPNNFLLNGAIVGLDGTKADVNGLTILFRINALSRPLTGSGHRVIEGSGD